MPSQCFAGSRAQNCSNVCTPACPRSVEEASCSGRLNLDTFRSSHSSVIGHIACRQMCRSTRRATKKVVRLLRRSSDAPSHPTSPQVDAEAAARELAVTVVHHICTAIAAFRQACPPWCLTKACTPVCIHAWLISSHLADMECSLSVNPWLGTDENGPCDQAQKVQFIRGPLQDCSHAWVCEMQCDSVASPRPRPRKGGPRGHA